MNNHEFLIYSAKEPMKILRKKFNRGESVYKEVPNSISKSEALEDISYVRYVMEQAYSGYTSFDKLLFDEAFEAMESDVKKITDSITANVLIDLISDHLSFICDGHLAFTTNEYGRGFYRKMQTFVADILLVEIGGDLVDTASGKVVLLSDGIRLFPTFSSDGNPAYLVGVRSKEAVSEITIKAGTEHRVISVHKIKSETASEEILIQESYDGDIACITCSSFVGDAEVDLDKVYEIGKKCRKYKHVIWNLSNNLGGNSDFPKRFLEGLTGGSIDAENVYELQSALVYAKETGEIKEMEYFLKNEQIRKITAENLFTGTLHVVINDGVASSGESAVIMAATMSNAVFYGCNSLGIGKFGDLCIYYFPNSKITLWCPQKVFDNSIEETVGYEPDIWVDSNDVISEVVKHICIG